MGELEEREMPIASYLVYPVEGQEAALRETLETLPGCSLVHATNAPVSILVTETVDREEEAALHQTLKGCETLAFLALVMGEVEGEMAPSVPDTFEIPALVDEGRAHG